MTLFAAHAVTPTCPGCDRSVRSSVQIREHMADLEELLNASEQLRASTSPSDLELRVVLLRTVDICAAELAAELAGHHLDCVFPDNAGNRIAATRSLLDGQSWTWTD